MNIHEYQAKELLRQYGVTTPNGYPCFSAAEAVQAAERLGGKAWVVKAQIHADGRGKGGGVKVARSIAELRELASGMLGARLVTAQTGPKGRLVKRLLVEEAVDIQKELYLGLTVDRSLQLVALIASDDGGMDIEQVAALTPERICKVCIDPFAGLKDKEADDVAHKLGVSDAFLAEARSFIKNFYKAFDECDAILAEINPLVLAGDGKLIALNVKIDFDPNALFRHPDIAALRDPDEEDPDEIEAARHELTYIPLGGEIGCLVNGAGLAMATMDAIEFHGGSPANFLDLGGGATTQRVMEAFKIMLRNPDLKAILVNIFGGIMRCDVIAQSIVEAARQVELEVPLVVRMKGTSELAGKRILLNSGVPLIIAGNMADAAEKAVNAAKGG